MKRIYIEISNICNLQCPFCIQNQRKQNIMQVNTFESILKGIQDICDYIYLHVLGEPLMHPYLDEILTLCDQYQKKVIITTNGTLLSQKKDSLLHDCIQTINISLHSIPYHQNTDIHALFEAGTYLSHHQKHINYRFWTLDENDFHSQEAKVYQQLLQYYGQNVEEKIGRANISKHVHIHFENQFEWPSMDHELVSDKGTCLGARMMCAILSNGDVVPCCLDSNGDIVLGNIFEDSFENIINSDRYQHMIKGFHENKLIEPLCQRCGYRTRFD